MKTFVTTLAAVALGAGMAIADPVEGVWKTEPGDEGGYLHVAISTCGEAICGVIRKAFDGAGAASGDYEHLNKRMLWDMKASGAGAYGGGKIWAPDREKTYNSKMELNGNQLVVKGCVFGVCRGQTWSRVQ